MTKPMKWEFNISTGKEIYQEMSDEEYANHLLDSESIINNQQVTPTPALEG